LKTWEKYDTIMTSKKLKLFSDFYLPIEIYKKNFQEYEEQEITYTVEEAKKIGIEEAKKKLDEQVENKTAIVDEKVYMEKTENYIEVEVIYEVLESIATKEKIVF